jgi:hypothetical protein
MKRSDKTISSYEEDIFNYMPTEEQVNEIIILLKDIKKLLEIK